MDLKLQEGALFLNIPLMLQLLQQTIQRVKRKSNISLKIIPTNIEIKCPKKYFLVELFQDYKEQKQ